MTTCNIYEWNDTNNNYTCIESCTRVITSLGVCESSCDTSYVIYTNLGD